MPKAAIAFCAEGSSGVGPGVNSLFLRNMIMIPQLEIFRILVMIQDDLVPWPANGERLFHLMKCLFQHKTPCVSRNRIRRLNPRWSTIAANVRHIDRGR